MNIIKIDNKEYRIKYGLRCHFRYEQLTGHPYEGKSVEDMYMFFHATLLACNENYTLTFDELIDKCDEDSSLFEAFKSMLEDVLKRNSQVKKKATEKKEKR